MVGDVDEVLSLTILDGDGVPVAVAPGERVFTGRTFQERATLQVLEFDAHDAVNLDITIEIVGTHYRARWVGWHQRDVTPGWPIEAGQVFRVEVLNIGHDPTLVRMKLTTRKEGQRRL